MPDSFSQRWLLLSRRILVKAVLAAALEAIYVLCRYRPSGLPAFTRLYSNSLFLLSLVLLLWSVLTGFGFLGWRRRHHLPSLFPSRQNIQAGELSTPAGQQAGHAENKLPQRDFSLMIASLILILLAAWLSPHSQ